MKHCYQCGKDKPFEQFSKRTKSSDGCHSYCKECHSEIMRKRYKDKKPFIDEQNKNLRLKIGAIVEEYRKSHPCIKCGETETCCLDFHHLHPESKINNISQLILVKNLQKVLTEIKKCVVLCSNCHRKLHAGKISL